jgi:alkanesulfonate monooxygenase SsuD/methylene tetrahydromethanopterin reductase-like flavin-dependent oxidoreductase (luciferase family)
MKFSAIYELQPGPGLGANQDRIVQVWEEALLQAELLDQLGWDCVWEVEHHFLGDYSSSSAPEIFLSAVAARTSQIRIGHGVVLLPREFNHVWRVAERIAALDIISNGRVEFGNGRSITKDELLGFGIDPADSRGMQLEAIEMLPRMFLDDTFSWDGTYYKLPGRRVTPRPVQQPHPPMWIAATQPESWKVAGKRGLGILSFGFSQPGMLEENIESYRNAIDTAETYAGAINKQIAVSPMMYCAETDEEALETAWPHVQFFVAQNIGFISQWKGTTTRAYDFYEKMAAFSDSGELFALPTFEPLDMPGLSDEARLLGAQVQHGLFCIGSPSTCAEFVQKHVDVGIDQLIFPAQFGTLTHEEITSSMRLFTEHVMPRFSTNPSVASAAASR